MKSQEIKYTNIILKINSLIDQGEIIDLNETIEKIKEQNLFNWLEEKFENRLILDALTKEDRNEIEIYFHSVWQGVNENKIVIKNNGLCLLIAYCLLKIREII
jgi:hypothetical protein